MNLYAVINLAYIIGAVLFIIGLKMLGSPKTARRGNMISAAGMLLAVIATLFAQGLSFHWIIVGLIGGSLVGMLAARLVTMTAMPEMVALLNGFGGIASLLVGWAVYHKSGHSDTPMGLVTAITICLTVLIGGLTFSGSLVAWGKLKSIISGKPLLFRGQHVVNGLLFLVASGASVMYCMNPGAGYPIFIAIIVISLLLGVLAVVPIGGADMPVVIALLNSYSGLAACAAGFVIANNMLIVAGALVGASGIILTAVMCKAMNRSLTNVLFSGFGAVTAKGGKDDKRQAHPISASESYFILEAARSVVVVPGYGLAVSQAQRSLRDLGELLQSNGCEVSYAIHPVAGRMPGHMNVLLAEADIPYEQLVEMDAINPLLPGIDVCLVIGANDVVNPAAREDQTSPIYGMPIIDADKARTVIVMKRSLATGFAGIDNPLFYNDNTRMLFGNAKNTLQELVAELKQ